MVRLQKCVLLLNLIEFLHVPSSHLRHSFDFASVIIYGVPSMDIELFASLYYSVFMLNVYCFLHQSRFYERFVV